MVTMDDADLIESYELQLWEIVHKMHKSNVRYSIVHGILKEMVETLETQDYCEKWLNQEEENKK